MGKLQRQSGIEALRLLAMLGIVLSHWGGHGSWSIEDTYVNLPNQVFLQLTQLFGEVGNCIFLLITGYFSAGRKDWNKGGITRIVKDVHLYSILVFLVVVFVGVANPSLGGVISALLPFVYTQYWFVLPFLVVMLLSPWINDILERSTGKVLKIYFTLLFAVEMLLPVIMAKTVSSNVGLFILVYSIGVLLRKGELKIVESKSMALALTAIGFVFAIGTVALLDLATQHYGLDCRYSMILIGRFSFVPVIIALGLLCLFKCATFSSVFINTIAKSAFAIYLISEHSAVYPWFWKNVFDNLEFADTPWMIPLAITQCLMVCIVCVSIDYTQKRIINITKSLIRKNYD